VNRVEAIIYNERAADELQAKADEHHWEAARLIAEELDTGTRQRELARQIGKSRIHIQRMIKCWNVREGGSLGSRSFNQVYHSPEVRGPAPQEPSRELEPYREDPEIVDAVIVDDETPNVPDLSVADIARLRRDFEDSLPPAQRTRDKLDRSNRLLLDVRNDLRNGVRLDDPLSSGIAESHLRITAEINPQLKGMLEPAA
jgi:hypothetical protein